MLRILAFLLIFQPVGMLVDQTNRKTFRPSRRWPRGCFANLPEAIRHVGNYDRLDSPRRWSLASTANHCYNTPQSGFSGLLLLG